MSKYDPDSSIKIANKAKILAEAMDYQKGIADAFLSNGRNFLYKDSLKQAILSFLNALRIYEDLSPCVEMGITLDCLSFMNMHVGRFDKAKAYAKQELEVFKQLSNRSNEILATNNIGLSYSRTGEIDSAFYYPPGRVHWLPSPPGCNIPVLFDNRPVHHRCCINNCKSTF
jgi:tetratricopeptide (TPR) repeat protein